MRCPYSSLDWNEGDDPVPGVVVNHAPEFLVAETDAGVDLAWESHLMTCAGQCANPDCRCNHDGGCRCDRAPVHDYDPCTGVHDLCGPEDMGTVLIGSWRKVGTQWEPDRDGEYAAVFGEIYTQVLWSRWTRRAAWCSPCFPSQGDLDNAGPVLAYDLPPEVWGEGGR